MLKFSVECCSINGFFFASFDILQQRKNLSNLFYLIKKVIVIEFSNLQPPFKNFSFVRKLSLFPNPCCFIFFEKRKQTLFSTERKMLFFFGGQLGRFKVQHQPKQRSKRYLIVSCFALHQLRLVGQQSPNEEIP